MFASERSWYHARVCVCIMSRQQLFFFHFFPFPSLSATTGVRRYPHTHRTCTRGVCRICVRDKDRYLRITQLRGVQSRFLSIKKQHVAQTWERKQLCLYYNIHQYIYNIGSWGSVGGVHEKLQPPIDIGQMRPAGE